MTVCRKKWKLLKPPPAQGTIYEKLLKQHCMPDSFQQVAWNARLQKQDFFRSVYLLQINFVFSPGWRDSCQDYEYFTRVYSYSQDYTCIRLYVLYLHIKMTDPNMNYLWVLDNLSILFQYFYFNTINILTYGWQVGRIQWNFI